MSWDADEIEEVRENALVDEAQQRIEVRRQRAMIARRNVQALGDVGGKLLSHVREPAMGLLERLGQALPYIALGAAAGGAGFLVYLGLRRKPRAQIIVMRGDEAVPRKGKRDVPR